MSAISRSCRFRDVRSLLAAKLEGLSGFLNAILTNNCYKLDADSRKTICVRMGTIKLVRTQIDFSAALKLEFAH